MAVEMTPLQLAVAMAVAMTVVAAAAALPPCCRAAAYACPAACASPEARAVASACHATKKVVKGMLLVAIQFLTNRLTCTVVIWYKVNPQAKVYKVRSCKNWTVQVKVNMQLCL